MLPDKLQEKSAFLGTREKQNKVRKKMTDLFGKIKGCPTNARNFNILQDLRVGRSVAVLYVRGFLLYMPVGQENYTTKNNI